ncbi:MAG: hypothetical protein IM631_13205 [Cytophagales bacterium]|jgi:hypothetical protein|nr:hypothetical protein [Cytophagales bacterium]MCA6372331.1 hypothetical protein [Cytophagales bacterium]MCA6382477.1 hypothetical protein [Cytophagales bacterium]
MNALTSTLAFFAFLSCGMAELPANDCTEVASAECLKAIPPGFNFLKGYPLSFEGREYLEYSYVFTSGTTYALKICKQHGNDVKLVIMDGSRDVVGSNQINGRLLTSVAYQCRATSIHYIKVFADKSSFCGSCVLAFSRK